MRAKFKVTEVTSTETADIVVMHPVSSGMLDSHGVSEDNGYACYTPCGEITLTVNNPNLIGRFKPGQPFCVDFNQSLD